MKKFSLALIAILIATALYFQLMHWQRDKTQPLFLSIQKPLSYRIAGEPSQEEPSRIGLNLGQWTSWGAQQYMRNILKNPGFEESINRLIVIVTSSNRQGFADEEGRGFPDRTWDGAEFQVLSGQHAGLKGMIQVSLENGDEGYPLYFTQDPIPDLERQSVVVLTKMTAENPVSNWWTSSPPRVVVDPEKRPNSPGSQSIKMQPDQNGSANVAYYLDTQANDAGKFLPLEQIPWRLSFWAKSDREEIPLEVSFRRLNDTPYFLQKNFSVSSEWQEFAVDFVPVDAGEPAPLKFEMVAVDPLASIWVDDVRLAAQGQHAFRQELVDLLQELRPEYLREHGHLADAMENRFATAFGRKPSAVSGNIGEYGYSLPEFFTLCEEVGANPWLIVPPTYTDEENMRFGEFLTEQVSGDRFDEVILEFGCENWNWAMRSTGIPYPDSCGEVAERAFEHIQHGAKNGVQLRKFVNGQHTIPWRSLAFLDSTSNADGLAIAPYFFYSLETDTADAEVLEELFKDDAGLMQEIGDGARERDRDFAVYAVNLHTTQGNAKRQERERAVTCAAAGSALAKRMLEAVEAGADPIMVYNLSQYDTSSWDMPERVKLWGITRDLGPPTVLRPTGLAMLMLNRVIIGDRYDALPDEASLNDAEKMTVASFKTPYFWSGALVSTHAVPVEVILEFPDDEHPLPDTLRTLHARNPFDNNEKEQKVTIFEQTIHPSGRKVRVTVPAWGFVTLGGQD